MSSSVTAPPPFPCPLFWGVLYFPDPSFVVEWAGQRNHFAFLPTGYWVPWSSGTQGRSCWLILQTVWWQWSCGCVWAWCDDLSQEDWDKPVLSSQMVGRPQIILGWPFLNTLRSWGKRFCYLTEKKKMVLSLHFKSLANIAAFLQLCILEQFFTVECLKSVGQVLFCSWVWLDCSLNLLLLVLPVDDY